MARRLFPLLLPIALAVGSGLGFAQTDRETVSAPSGPVATPPEPPAAADARRAQVIARFDGGTITVGQLEDAIANKAPVERRRLAERAAQVELLRAMVDYELLILEAKRRGYERDPVVMQRATVTLADTLKEDFALDPAGIPDDQVRARYQQQGSRFNLPRLRQASLIVLASSARASELAVSLAGRGRIAFAQAAREHSLDEATRVQDGQLGFFDEQGRRTPTGTPWEVDKPLVEATFATEPGRISEPFEYAGDFAIVAVTAENDAAKHVFAAVAPTLRAALAEEAQGTAIARLVDQRLVSAPPTVRAELLERVDLPNPEPRRIPQGEPAAPRDPTAPARYTEPDGA